MYGKLIILLAIAARSALAVDMEAGYAALDRLLVERLAMAEEHPAINVEVARDLLADMEAGERLSEAPLEADEQSLRAALSQFSALADVLNEQILCTDVGAVILDNNHQAVKSHAQDEPARRVNQVVDYYVNRQAQICLPLHARMYREGKAQLQATTSGLLNKFLFNVAANDMDWTYLESEKPHAQVSLVSPDNAKMAIEAMKTLAAAEPSVASLTSGAGSSSEHVRALYSKYIVEPCETLIKAFDGLFDMYEQTLNNARMPQTIVDLTNGFASNRICKTLVTKERDQFLDMILQQLA